jgi:hypothetical protein
VGLERGPFSLMSRIEELLGWKRYGSSLEIREYGRGYPQKMALTSQTSDGRSVGIVCSRTGAKEFVCWCGNGLWKRSIGTKYLQNRALSLWITYFKKYCILFVFSSLDWGETECTWHVNDCLAYSTSPGWWMMMSVEQSVEWKLAGETEVLGENLHVLTRAQSRTAEEASYGIIMSA